MNNVLGGLTGARPPEPRAVGLLARLDRLGQPARLGRGAASRAGERAADAAAPARSTRPVDPSRSSPACCTRSSRLISLDLEANDIADGALSALLRLAAVGRSLQALHLSANSIGTDGARALASHLIAHPEGPLRSIGLSNNPLGKAGVKAIAVAVRGHAALVELSMLGTGASDADIPGFTLESK
mgnify:CR=1 FL=1